VAIAGCVRPTPRVYSIRVSGTPGTPYTLILTQANSAGQGVSSTVDGVLPPASDSAVGRTYPVAPGARHVSAGAVKKRAGGILIVEVLMNDLTRSTTEANFGTATVVQPIPQ
jgi:hypothetical protein